MELKDLKTAWKAVEPHIENISQEVDKMKFIRHSGVKSKLVWRLILAALTTFMGLAFMATSWLWAPIKLPVPQLITTCLIIFIGFIAELLLARSITKINLWHDTNIEVFNAVVKIKKTYKHMELWFSVFIALSIGWLTMTPPLVNTDRPFFVWIALAIALGIEYMYYRKTIKTLNELTTD